MNDPGRSALRRAARATLVMPSVFALYLVGIEDERAATFASFGAFALLVFADFGGPLRRRARAYLALTAAGACLIPIATLASQSGWSAVPAMAVAAFAITFSGAFSSYVAAARMTATLAFVLAVTIPADAAAIPQRLEGWLVAGAVSTLAAVALWPRRERRALHEAASAVSSAVAELVEAFRAPDPVSPALAEKRAVALARSRSLTETWRETPYRPVGPTVHDQSLGYLVRELWWSRRFADELALDRAKHAALPELDSRLGEAVAATFGETAAGLVEVSETIHLVPLEEERTRHRIAVERWVEVGAAGGDALPRLRRAFRLRALSFAALSVAANAMLLRGERLPDVEFEVPPLVPEPTLSGAVRRLGAGTRSLLRLDSVWMRDALRAALGLGLAVLIARVGRLDHAFWVALATLSVLKSNSSRTGHTAWQAVLGTTVGFGLASALVSATSDDSTGLWIAFPICAFLAAYTPTAIHFVVGQSMFTVLVVALFNLIEPQGYRTGEVRLEDIAIGAGTSVLVIALLWPRGARGQLRTAIAALFEAGASHLEAALGAMLGTRSAAEADATRTGAVAAAVRANEAFETFLKEGSPVRVPVTTWGTLVAGGVHLRFVADALVAYARARGPVAAASQARTRLEQATTVLAEEIARAGRRLLHPGEPAPSARPRGFRPERADVAAGDAGDALRLVWTGEWLDQAFDALDELAKPLAETGSAAARPWWR